MRPVERSIIRSLSQLSISWLRLLTVNIYLFTLALQIRCKSLSSQSSVPFCLVSPLVLNIRPPILGTRKSSGSIFLEFRIIDPYAGRSIFCVFYGYFASLWGMHQRLPLEIHVNSYFSLALGGWRIEEKPDFMVPLHKFPPRDEDYKNLIIWDNF